MLSTTQLGLLREARWLFSDISITIKAHELWQVVGANGSGKSSLLALLAGFAWPSVGEVHYHGKAILPDRSLFASKVAYLGHQNGLTQALTIEEELQFFLALSSLPPSNFLPLLEELQLASYVASRVVTLSAGQKKRLALAKVILSQRPLWLLDEPFANLDSLGEQTINSAIINHCQKGGCVVFTTHSPSQLLTPKTIQLGVRDEHSVTD